MACLDTERRSFVARTKIAVTLQSKLLQRLDALAVERRFPNRSHAIELAVAALLERAQRARLARECAKLDPIEENAFAEEGIGKDLDAPAHDGRRRSAAASYPRDELR